LTVDLDTRQQIVELNAAYAACLDDGRYDEWPAFFVDDGWYRIVARENYERGLPLSILSLKGVPMMKDRIYGISSTIFHAPYYQTHIIGPSIITAGDDGQYNVASSYVVYRTKRDMTPDVLSVGKFLDVVDRRDGKFKFRRKFCIFDNDTIPNSIIYPI